MSDAAVRQAEIAVEQHHVDRVYARLTELRTEARAARARGFEQARGAAREAIFEQAQMLLERDVMVRHANRLLHQLDSQHEGLVFGRLDMTDAERLYVGRLGVRDRDFHSLVIDWRAPVAAAFYQATANEPMNVLRRRSIRCSSQTVVDVDDEAVMPAELPADMPIVGEGALMASLSRARGDTMRDIVATIQREQDEVIRAPLAGVTEITGGPGTGKTVVALHRVAYLLYTEHGRLGRAGVLIVGPSTVFINYIWRVLPSMGEDAAELRALGDLLDGCTATHLDPAPVAAVKGSLRMRRVLRRAVRATPPDAPGQLRVRYGGATLTMDSRELERVRRAVHRRGGEPNRSRVDAAEALLDALARKAKQQADEQFRPDRQALITEVGERIEFHRFLVRWWPPLTAGWVLSWLRDRERLARAAVGVLTGDEVDLLAKSWADPSAGHSIADIALLDELRVLVGRQPARRRRGAGGRRQAGGAGDGGQQRPADQPYTDYLHVVVDEAQDVTPMQWRMIGRRGQYASWTLVGDPAQTSWPDPAEAAAAKESALGSRRTRRQYVLRTNYRNSAEIFALAARVVDTEVVGDTLPNAVRSTGVEPQQRTAAVSELAAEVRAGAAELLGTVDGTVGVITTMARTAEAAGWVHGLDQGRLRVIGSIDAKGLEYDAVVVVEPADLVAESSTGRNALYVALTRATQRLTVVGTDPDWLDRRSPAQPVPQLAE